MKYIPVSRHQADLLDNQWLGKCEETTMEQLKEILELLYLLSGPAIAVLAYLALAQIKIARKQLEEQRKATRISSKRDALKTMSEQVAKYGSEIIPLINALDHKIESENIEFFSKSKVEITSEGMKVFPCSDLDEREKVKSKFKEFTDMMNALEGFSAFFISGVADEKTAFHSLSTTFCNTVKDKAPLILMTSEGKHHFEATLSLFRVWNTRLETENLEKKKSELERKLRSQKTQYVDTIDTDT